MLARREGEDITAFTVRRMRAEFLEEVRDRIMSLQPDMSALKEEHKIGFRSGYAACRRSAQELITDMIED